MLIMIVDAGGNIPLSVQKLGIPSAIVKDVGCFLKWLQDKRELQPV